MSSLSKSARLAVGALLAATLARADFQSALKDYNAGRYEAAHGEFLALAELGDCSSQFNLGAMALKGQGGPPDTASGVGWLEAAAGNGCKQLVGNKLTRLSGSLSPDQSLAAAHIVQLYGPDTLRAEGVVDPDFSCRELTPAKVTAAAEPEYPPTRQNSIIVAAMTIGTDGRARDPQVLLAIPDQAYAAAAVEAWFNSQFSPAMREGHAVPLRVQLQHVFTLEGAAPLADEATLRSARPAADAGDPSAAYLLGLAATYDPALGIPSERAGQLLIGAARDGGAPAQFWIGSQLRASSACHPHADGAVWLRHAAAGGSAPAQLTLAGDLLEGNPGNEQIIQARALLAQAATADDYYVRKHVVALLAASSVPAVRDPALAGSLALKLAANGIPSDPQMYEVLAAARAANGEFREAAALQGQALSRALNLHWDTRAMADRLGSYRAGKPWNGDLFAAP